MRYLKESDEDLGPAVNDPDSRGFLSGAQARFRSAMGNVCPQPKIVRHDRVLRHWLQRTLRGIQHAQRRDARMSLQLVAKCVTWDIHAHPEHPFRCARKDILARALTAFATTQLRSCVELEVSRML